MPSYAAACLLLDPPVATTSSSDASSSLLPTRKIDFFLPFPFDFLDLDLGLPPVPAREVAVVPVEAGEEGAGDWSRD